ncbi:hypothetical protein VTI74DRAFT_1307 [Chaetomium olivicolor]
MAWNFPGSPHFAHRRKKERVLKISAYLPPLVDVPCLGWRFLSPYVLLSLSLRSPTRAIIAFHITLLWQQTGRRHLAYPWVTSARGRAEFSGLKLRNFGASPMLVPDVSQTLSYQDLNLPTSVTGTSLVFYLHLDILAGTISRCWPAPTSRPLPVSRPEPPPPHRCRIKQ